jgi:hypothetical protein
MTNAPSSRRESPRLNSLPRLPKPGAGSVSDIIEQ